MRSKENWLKIKGTKTEDIMIISGFTQDALIAPSEMTVEQDKRRFVAILNRFMWERSSHHAEQQGDNVAVPSSDNDGDARFEDASDGRFWRVQSALTIERCDAIKRKNLIVHKNDTTLAGEDYLYLLGIVPDKNGVTLYFAGGGMLRIEGLSVQVFLEDLSEPWPTPQMPIHEADDMASV